MTHEKGSVFGGILLITGCCVGAGMLGLPLLSAVAGFKPSFLMFILSWLFMACTGLLLLEVNLWFDDEVSIITMAGRTLGTVGQIAGWGLFLFLFYSLMVAYVSASGALFADFAREIAGLSVAPWVGSLGVILLFGLLIYMGTSVVDDFNRLLMLGLVVTYVILIAVGLPKIDTELLGYTNWAAAPLVIPAMIISFGYHNLIPTLKNYMHGDVRRLRWTVLIGSSIPLLIYLLWESVLLGLIPVEGDGGFAQALGEGDMVTKVLRSAAGGEWIVDLTEYFAFFAIVTSFLSVALSFVDFLADGLHVAKGPVRRGWLCAMALAPPFFFALLYPKVFLTALTYAGAFGAVALFGILPAAMVWAGRYRQKLDRIHVMPGGRWTLVVIMLASLTIMGLELAHLLRG